MGMQLQALETIFEAQKKRSNEKITKKEISFPIYKMFFFPLFLFGPLRFLLSNLIIF
jgi:hypothetical protein